MRKTFGTLAVLMVGVCWLVAQARAQGPRGETALRDGKISIDYGRPSARGRNVIELILPGDYWRMGADAATKLTTSVPLRFGEKTVAPGTYTLLGHFTAKDEWSLVVARGLGREGPIDLQAEVPGRMLHGQEHVEQMTIDLREEGDHVTFELAWGTSRLVTDFNVGS